MALWKSSPRDLKTKAPARLFPNCGGHLNEKHRIELQAVLALSLNAARTLKPGLPALPDNGQQASPWKYVPIRRLALFIEASLYQGTQWVCFEPNNETLWGQLRWNVGTFLQGLFVQGAFQGSSAQEAYFVKCDSETTTPADVAQGVVNILVGFAPLYPAEFVVITISQLTGQEAD